MNNEDKNIVGVMKESFIKYSMSVIVARALPDLRDGLKPVHRRILFDMYEDGLTPDKAYRKSATTVGAVLGKYHPHGDSSVYDALVRMAQDFSYRFPLVDGHGNFGSIDGYGAAAYRYTEARLSKISLELLRDINKETIDYDDNFDSTRKEPRVLPSRFPNILVNGTMGIAVGMATNIPPHNLGEVIDGCVAYIDNHDVTLDDLMQYIKGPDFPTGGMILGTSGIRKAYEAGRGTITIRSHAEIIEENGKTKIVFSDLPYQVTKLSLKTRIGELVRDKIIDGIADLHDESSLQDGIKIVVHLKKEANANVILNNLYKHTQLQSNYGIIFLMLDEGQPKTLGLKDIISKYIEFQKNVVYRRTLFDCKKAEARVHLLAGYKIALDHIDEVIKIIRAAHNDEDAKNKLMSNFGLDSEQTDAILAMQLRRLTGLEREKIEDELKSLIELIKKLKEILASEQMIYDIIKTELLEIKQKYSDERRTEINHTAVDYIEDESLIPVENSVITLTNKGYIKRLAVDTYRAQNRGGMGIKGMATNEEDSVQQMLNVSTHDYVLFFTNKGKVYRLKGYEVPEYSRQAKGLPIINLLQIEKDELVNSIIKLTPDDYNNYLVFATRNGLVKRTKVSEFENIRQTGKICISLKENDELIGVKQSNGEQYIAMGSNDGRMAVFKEEEIRCMGRTASGVHGMNLSANINCIGIEVVVPESNLLIVTEKGYGKKTIVSEYRFTKRGSKGVKALNITEKNGNIASFKVVNDQQDIIIITNSGMVIRMSVNQISQLGRVTQGVRLINLKDEQIVSTISIVDRDDSIENNDEDNINNTIEITDQSNTIEKEE